MKKVLIANRGEIAARVIRACDDNNLESVAVYADVDADAFYVHLASEAYALFGNTPAETYLNIEKVIDVALRSGCDAIHPGYGFLSESAEFAEAVIAADLTWIGPPPEVIRTLGDKLSARAVAVAVGAPLAPGSDGPVETAEEVAQFGEKFGYPIIVKAAHGGGGRGMKIVRTADEVDEAFSSAVRESILAFGRGECFVEKYLEQPRHIEAQVVADAHGTVLVLGTRDCSIQRRNQKLIEEAPAPFLAPEVRDSVTTSAAAICREVGYIGVGTVEYLLDSNNVLSFLEVNTRLQVEHPVTEETSGIDLVATQFAIAAGENIDLEYEAEPSSHSIEFRINAEDPARGFIPSPGIVTRVEWPVGPGIRVDSGVVTGSLVAPQFDSLIAKIIVTGKSREQAIRRARRALTECIIEGIATTIPFHLLVLDQADFVAEEDFACYTSWIETELNAALETSDEYSNLQLDNELSRVTVELDGKLVAVRLPRSISDALTSQRAQSGAETQSAKLSDDDPAHTLAPSTGVFVKWLVQPGDAVAAGEPIAVLEAMKMETQVFAHRAGRVSELTLEPGAQVLMGDTMVSIT